MILDSPVITIHTHIILTQLNCESTVFAIEKNAIKLSG